MGIDTILLIISFILLVLAAFRVAEQRVSLGWLGLACFVATALV